MATSPMMTGNYFCPDHHRMLRTFRTSAMLFGCFMTKQVLQVITFHLSVASINAVHSSASAAAAQSDEAGGLEPIVFLASGANVMLTANLWPEVGLCNGARDKDLEIILKNSSKIQRSPHNFDAQQCHPAKREHTNLEDIKDLPNFVEITTTAKAISVHKPIMVAGGKTKQDIIIADATSTAPLTLWETDVDCLIEGNTYSFTNLLVRTFQGKKQLSAPKHAAIVSDDDITDVASAESSDSDSDSSMTLKNAEIIAVPVFSSYTACLTCKAKVEPKSAKVGNCTKCTMPQRLDKCVKQLSAKVIIQAGT